MLQARELHRDSDWALAGSILQGDQKTTDRSGGFAPFRRVGPWEQFVWPPEVDFQAKCLRRPTRTYDIRGGSCPSRLPVPTRWTLSIPGPFAGVNFALEFGNHLRCDAMAVVAVVRLAPIQKALQANLAGD